MDEVKTFTSPELLIACICRLIWMREHFEVEWSECENTWFVIANFDESK